MKQYRVTVEQTFKKICVIYVDVGEGSIYDDDEMRIDLAKGKAEELSKHEPFSNEAYLTEVYAKDAEEILACPQQ